MGPFLLCWIIKFMVSFVELRHQRLREGIEFGKDRCLEVGALNFPVLKREDGHVFYTDHLSLEGLKQQFSWDKNFNYDQLAPVDYVWEKGRSLSECVEGSFDYVVASHVGEHVPNLIGWIEEIRQVLKPKGQLRLTLPDGRYSFDMKRQATRLSDLLAAWMKQSSCPETHLVLDFALNKVSDQDVPKIHAQYDQYPNVEALKAQFPFSEVLEWGERTLIPDHYEDVHCWVLNLNLFAQFMVTLTTHNIVKMACINGFDIDPSVNSFEFTVFLSPEDDKEKCVASWKKIYEQTKRVSSSDLWRHYQNVKQENLQLKNKIEGIYQSHSWRITEPLRRLVNFVKLHCYKKS